MSRIFPFCIGWWAGTAWQLQAAELWAGPASAVLMALGVGVCWVALSMPRATRWGRCDVPAVLLCLAAGAVAFGQTSWRASRLLEQALDPRLEGRNVTLVGQVSALPQRMGDSWRFRFEVTSGPEGVPEQVLLGWYGSATWNAPGSVWADPPPQLRVGDRWQLTVRLKAPHGHINPHGFDHELWLWEQGLRATGYVRAGPADAPPVWLGRTAMHPVEAWRQRVRDAVDAQVSEPRTAGAVTALLVGDQAAIERADWDLFRATGVAHLMAISGLHITGLAWLVAAAVGWAWRRSDVWSRSRPWSLWLPAQHAGLVGGVLAALAYAVFTGWGVPAQRTVWMLSVVSVLRWHGRRWPWPHIWAVVCGVVLALDPWAMLQAGFWLSFVAVGVLFASGAVEQAPSGTWAQRSWQGVQRMVREQWRMSVCLAPLSLLLFHQVSVVGLLANLLAVPWVTLVVTPLCLLGVLWAPLWSAAAWALDGLVQVLSLLAQGAWAQWSAPAAPVGVGALALLGMAVLALRWPLWMRLCGLVWVLPLVAWQPPRPPSGEFEVIAADMGQGHAVLVRTAHHALLYDTGPRYSAETDAGQRVLVPLLRSLGERLDRVVISHQDSDHSGGALAVMAMQPQAQVLSSIPEGHVLQSRLPLNACERGQRWIWDGVAFEVLHPQPQDYASRNKPNAMSCVLRVQSERGVRALLVGDIEAAQERRLTQQEDMQADWLLVPHHGSATSSTRVFLEAVAPQVAVVQAGYRNRFGHPRPEVMARYEALGVLVVQTPRCGASRWHSESPKLVHCERDVQQRYWHHRLP